MGGFRSIFFHVFFFKHVVTSSRIFVFCCMSKDSVVLLVCPYHIFAIYLQSGLFVHLSVLEKGFSLSLWSELTSVSAESSHF